MLAEREAHTTLPARDLERARRFYAEKLGLTPNETPGGLMYRCRDSWFLVFQSGGSASGAHTQMGWQVDDIEQEVADLKANGIVFEEYDWPTLKTVNGIATSPAGRAAWFKDSEGNMLGLIQFKA